MCPVNRRRYQNGGFNGQWTSQLAPSQCSGTLFPLPPQLHPFSVSLSLSPLSSFSSISLSLFPLLYTSFCYVLLPMSSSFIFSLRHFVGSSPRSRTLSVSPPRTKLPAHTRPGKASGPKRDITGSSSRHGYTGTQKTGVLSYPRRSL